MLVSTENVRLVRTPAILGVNCLGGAETLEKQG